MIYYLFPFDKVPKDSRIVLYGAGNVGKQFFAQIAETNFCKIVLWVDKNADLKTTEKPEAITSLSINDYDIVVIAIESELAAHDIKSLLMSYRVPENKILHKIHKPNLLYVPNMLNKSDLGTGILENVYIEKIELNEKQRTNYNDINFTDIELYDKDVLEGVEKLLFGQIEGTVYSKSEMPYEHRAFLNGIIRKAKPKIIVEIGLSAGGSSCVILNAIRDIDNAKLYSFDYNTIWYRDMGKNNGRKTGFLVNQIVPDLVYKWEFYGGGVPCKHFEAIPKEGVDICFIDTAHFNPGEHLNILEILPFMKKNAIVIYHDTAYHALADVNGITNLVSINTLNGKRILAERGWLGTQMSLPNIEAIILDENINDMLFPLFSNLSLPWHYKITKDDFVEMFKHFSKYYSKDLVQIYVYYCYFYMNGGLLNKEFAGKIANKESLCV